MSIANQIIELLSLEERRVNYFHGTSTRFLREILKKGFIPDPKKKVWDAETGSLESFFGTYFTDNWMTAYGAAGDASRKLGGNRVIFEVQLETRTGLADEDEIPSAYGALTNAVGVSRIIIDNAKSIVHSFDPSQKPSDRYYVPKSFEKDMGQEAFDLWVEDFDRRMGGFSKLELSAKLVKKIKPFFMDYLKEILKAQIKFDMESDPQVMNKTTPELKSAKAKFIKSLGPKPLGRYDGGTNFNNIRIAEPVTFKGKNKILSAIEIIEDAETVTPDPNDKVSKPYKVTHLVPRYGTISDKFKKMYGQRIGGSYKVVK